MFPPPEDVEVRFYHEGGEYNDAHGRYDRLNYLLATRPPRLPGRSVGQRIRRIVIIKRIELMVTPPQVFPAASKRLPRVVYDGTHLTLEGTSYRAMVLRLLEIIKADRNNARRLSEALAGHTRAQPRQPEEGADNAHLTGQRHIRRGNLVLVHSDTWPEEADDAVNGGDEPPDELPNGGPPGDGVA